MNIKYCDAIPLMSVRICYFSQQFYLTHKIFVIIVNAQILP